MTHAHAVRLNDGRQVLMSYQTPVAAFVPGRGYLKRDRYYSQTTSKHVNDFAGPQAPKVTEDEFLTLIAPVIGAVEL